MLDEMTKDFNPTPDFRPSAFDKLLSQLPEELKPLVRQSRDGLLTAMGIGYIDVVKFDKLLSKAYPEYNSKECTYNGEPCSMSEFVELEFGGSAWFIINRLIGSV